jgi:pseudaminic acid synthase
MLTIGSVAIGGNNPCRTIAEISCNHNGDFDRAIRLIDAAKTAGADFAKFQCYTPDELVTLRGDGPAPEPWGSQGWTMRALYEKAQTPHAWFPRLFQHARDIGIVPFSSVFGADSLDCLYGVRCPAFKIARLDNAQQSHFAAVTLNPDIPVLISRCGDEPWGTRLNTHYLWCPPGYPTRSDDVKLPERFHDAAHIGLSSHCLDPRLPVAAVARGAKLLEYHFQLDDEPSELEADVSLCASEFAAMVADVRATEAMLA